MEVNESKLEVVRYREIVRQCEEKLRAQLQLAVAADQRAVSIATVFAALVSGVIAVYGALEAINEMSTAYRLGVGVSVAIWGYALTYVLSTVKPALLGTPGGSLKDWEEDIAKNSSFEKSLADVAEHMSADISDNEILLEENGKTLWMGLKLGFAAPFFGITAFIISKISVL